MSEIRIGGAVRETLVITVIDRERPQSTDFYDGNWLRAAVDVNVGGFQARVSGTVRAEEFVGFRDEVRALTQSIEGQGTFHTTEDWLAVEMRGDRRGHLAVKGRMQDDAGSVNQLTFRLELDQTFLPGILAGLEEVTQSFPVQGNPRSPWTP